MSPVETLPYDASGMLPSQARVKKGATSTLTIPTTSQKGSVFAQMTIVTPQNPNSQDYAIQVAAWPLSS
jgi:hypothetical protein